MNQLVRAAEVADSMRRALEVEIGRARDQRVLIRKMDGQALLESARRRGMFNVQLAMWEGELAGLLGAIKQEHGWDEITLETMALRAPSATAVLRERLGEVRSLAAALRELDVLNQQLSERALLYVRSYAAAIVPRSSAYDRRGAVTAEPPISTASRTV